MQVLARLVEPEVPAGRGDAERELINIARSGVSGHTRMPFVRLVGRRLVVNLGSTTALRRGGGAWALRRKGR